MRQYIYECVFSNGNKIITKNIEEIVEKYNNEYDEKINYNKLYTHIYKDIKLKTIIINKQKLQTFFKDELIKKYGDRIDSVSKRQISRYYDIIYKSYRLNNN